MLGPLGSRLLLSNLEVPLEDPGIQGMNFNSGFSAASEAQKIARPTSVAELHMLVSIMATVLVVYSTY